MTGEPEKLRIVKWVQGEGTGDMNFYTLDGRKWIPWDGFTKTGEEVKMITDFES